MRSFATLLLVAGLFTCCGPGAGTEPGPGTGGGSQDIPDAGGPADGGSLAHEIAGFDLQVGEGSWWEYLAASDDSYIFDTGNGSDHAVSTYVLKLGAPTTIDGDVAYPVSRQVVASACSSNPGSCTPAATGAWAAWTTWPYLSFAGQRIRGSTDGLTYSVLFDANTGIWRASSHGLFGDFPSSDDTRIASQQSGDTYWHVQETNSSTNCDNIPGYGTVCSGSGDLSNAAGESYDPSLGCVQSYYFGQTSGSSGSSSASRQTTLVGSSLSGALPVPVCGVPWPTSACASCMNGQCCAPQAACAANPECLAILGCYAGCAAGDSTCASGCYSAHPKGQADVDPLDACLLGTCASSCT
jgi:hypothetical protein